MRRGFTLVELLVVLVLMGLAVGLVAPALQPPQAPAAPPIAPLLSTGRAVAIARGESTVLRVNAAGDWRIDGRGSTEGDPLATGTLPQPPGAPFSIIFSPLGTCAADIRSGAAESLPVDPLTCELRPQ